jgi:hypothetical protein
MRRPPAGTALFGGWKRARRRCRLRPGRAHRTAPSGQPSLSLGLTGRHQAGNAHLALRAVAAMAARDGWALDADAIWLGMRSATLPGRFERRVIAGRPAVLDGAHNPMKLAALVTTLHEVYRGPVPVGTRVRAGQGPGCRAAGCRTGGLRGRRDPVLHGWR